jgi:hypothetical protein
MSERLNFNIKHFYNRAKRMKDNVKVGDVSINLPFISFNMSVDFNEKKIAKEIIIRLRDKRVLNSKECCDNCIDNSLKSLLSIREFLVDKQVEIENVDSTLFLLVDFALYGIKRFLTYTESFDLRENMQEYFDSLNIIRGHLLRTFNQIAKIAELPEDFGFRKDCVDDWKSEFYMIKENN